MKKLTLIFLIFLSLRSCDTFRRMAGRPTSEDIRKKKELIASNEEAERIRQAKLEEQRRLDVDSLNAVSEIRERGIEVRGCGNLADSMQLLPGRRYYIITGAYRSAKNVNRASEMMQACGFEAVPLKFRNGYTAIGVNPTCRVADCMAVYNRVTKLPFCPENCWILDVEK